MLELDVEKRRLKLGMKQLLPTSIEEYIADHHEGDTVSGRIVEISGESARGIGRGHSGCVHDRCRTFREGKYAGPS